MSHLLREAFKEMLIVDYGHPDSAEKLLDGQYCGARDVAMIFARIFVNFANDFCLHWSTMDMCERKEFCRDFIQCIPTEFSLMHEDGEAMMDPSDFGTMLYHVYINYKLERGYTSMIPIMVTDMPQMEPEVLTRKLSVDYHAIIPILFPDGYMKETLLQKIEALANKHNVSITVPTDKTVRRGYGDDFIDSLEPLD